MTTPAFSLTADERRRIERIDQLVALGDAGVAELLAAMSDPSWTVRRAAVAALAALGDDAIPALARWLSETRTNEAAIAAAVDALAASLGDATGVLVDLLGHPDPAVVCDAAHILGRRRAVAAVPALARALAHPDDNVGVAVIEALGGIGGAAAVEPLIAVLAEKRFFRTFPALQVLPRTGDPRAVAPLAALLADDTYRLEAARALGRTGSALAVAPLASLLARPEPAMVPLVALALGDLIVRAEWMGALDRVTGELARVIAPALPRFVQALASGEPEERTAIAALLGRLGDASALPALARLLDEPALADTATAAIQRLARAHEAAVIEALRSPDAAARIAVLPVVAMRSAAPALRALLADDEPEVRARACDALARIGDTAAVPALFTHLGDPSPRVAHAAAAAIQSLGSDRTPALAIAALAGGDPATRRQALRVIGTLGCDGAYDAVRAAVDDRDRRIAELAVTALGALADPRVDAALAELAGDTRATIRAAALRAVTQRGGAAALLHRGLADPDAWVRYVACQGLGRLGAATATPALVERLADDAPHVRIAAIEALARLDGDAAWQALCAMVASPDPDQQRAALVGIGLRDAAEALPYLLAATAAAEPATRLIAISALAGRAEPAAITAIASAANDEAPEVRDAALSLLAERTDRAAADQLVALALAAEPDHPAHLALSRPGAARIAAISDRLRAAGDRDAAALTAALARMHDGGATAALFAALELPSPVARRSAAAALIAIDAEGARARVGELATQDPDPDVRRACAAAIAG